MGYADTHAARGAEDVALREAEDDDEEEDAPFPGFMSLDDENSPVTSAPLYKMNK